MARHDHEWPSQFDGWCGHSKPPNYEGRYTEAFQLGSVTGASSGSDCVEFELPVDLYEYCTNRPRTNQYGVYVADPFHEPFLNDVVDTIRETALGADADDSELRNAIIEFVQSLDYTKDVDDTGHMAYPKYPIETLRHRQGDCEDGTILLGSLLSTVGDTVALLAMPTEHHMVLGIALEDYSGASVCMDGTEYYLLETTATGFAPGDLPSRYSGAEVEFHLPDEQAVLVHEWKAVPAGSARVEISCHLANFGTTAADDVSAQLTFEHRDGRVETGVVFDRGFSIEPGSSVSYTEPLRLKPETKLQGVFAVGIGGVLHDRSTSEWK